MRRTGRPPVPAASVVFQINAHGLVNGRDHLRRFHGTVVRSGADFYPVEPMTFPAAIGPAGEEIGKGRGIMVRARRERSASACVQIR